MNHAVRQAALCAAISLLLSPAVAAEDAATLDAVQVTATRVERPLDLDSQGQLVASVLSKKAAAGATHVLIDMPVGLTAKVRSAHAANLLGQQLEQVGQELAGVEFITQCIHDGNSGARSHFFQASLREGAPDNGSNHALQHTCGV